VREAIAALESALGSLEHAQNELPADLRSDLEKIVDEARTLLASLRAKSAEAT
jgi:hypothetical protein